MDETCRKLISKIDHELDTIADGKMGELDNPAVRDALDKLAHIKKSLLTAEAMEQGNWDGYGRSYGVGYDARMMAPMDRGYDQRGGRRSYGVNGSRQDMRQELQDMMMRAGSETERRAIERAMRELESN